MGQLPEEVSGVRPGTSGRGEEEGKVPHGVGIWGRVQVLPGVSLPVDKCGAEEEIEVAGETGGPDPLTWGGVRRVHQ